MSGDHIDGIISGVDHMEFKSGQDTSDDSMRASPGYQCRTLGAMRQHKPCREKVKGSNRLYGRKLWMISNYE